MHDDREEFIRERGERLSSLKRDDPVWGVAREFYDRSIPLRYSYNFDWLGVPVIQYPQDLVALQEIIWRVQPDLIVETGVARGGSLIFYASMLRLLGNGGRVVGVDIDIRPHNRDSIEGHRFADSIVLIEGSSVADEVLDEIRTHVRAARRPMVVLDSDHSRDHVARELELYAPFVRRGSYIVVCDTVVEYMPPETVADRDWGQGDSPLNAVEDFLKATERFVVDSSIDAKLLISVSPSGYLECIADPGSDCDG